MTISRLPYRLVAVLSLAMVLGACGGQREPAQTAISEAEAAVAALRDDAEKFAPGELTELENSLAILNADFAREDFKAVLAAAPVLMTRVSAVQETIVAKKAEQEALVQKLTDSWNSLSAEVPELLDVVTARVDSLARTKKFPAGMNATTFETTRASVVAMTQDWQKALGAFANSNMQEAVAMAQSAKDRATEAMNALGMKPGS